MTSRDVMRTDADWEHFARTDAYWAVLTSDEFRQQNLDDKSRTYFFTSGEQTIEEVIWILRSRIDPEFAPRRALDFGCGVGRLLIPLARRCAAAVGVDVAETMLREAAANCRAAGVENVELVKGDDELSAVSGSFDLVHTYIVLQHIPVERGLRIFRRLVELIAPGGCGAIHAITWVKPVPEQPQPSRLRAFAQRVLRPVRHKPPVPDEPVMQMNVYPVNTLLHILRECGVQRVHVDLTEHHGPEGVRLFFRREPAAG